MPTLKPLSGKELNLPYSFSRWTDVPIDRWSWFKELLERKEMLGFHPEQMIPYRWSLRAVDTLGLIFWTKDPTNVMCDGLQDLGYKVKVHVTVTGWEEVEGKAPSLQDGATKLSRAYKLLGDDSVIWRFSPIPILDQDEVISRFQLILDRTSESAVKRVYTSFLQPNDLIPETRSELDRLNLLVQMGEVAQQYGVRVLLCNEDKLLAAHQDLHPNVGSGVCAPPEDFALPKRNKPLSEGCGCVLMVDPFNINESCRVGCRYCYVADLHGTRKDSSKEHLRILQG
jgi:DNA repair photolyase